jgi:hypothetical protein
VHKRPCVACAVATNTASDDATAAGAGAGRAGVGGGTPENEWEGQGHLEQLGPNDVVRVVGVDVGEALREEQAVKLGASRIKEDCARSHSLVAHNGAQSTARVRARRRGALVAMSRRPTSSRSAGTLVVRSAPAAADLHAAASRAAPAASRAARSARAARSSR